VRLSSPVLPKMSRLVDDVVDDVDRPWSAVLKALA
jgi:hypothetical protein